MKKVKEIATEVGKFLSEVPPPALEAPKVEEELRDAQAALAERMRTLRELEASQVTAGEVAELARKRQALIEEIDAAKFAVHKLETALRAAEERDRKAKKAYEERKREALRPFISEAVDRLAKEAERVGRAYKELLAVCDHLDVDRVAGPALALVACAILREHDLGNPGNPRDIEAVRLQRWVGLTKVDLDLEARNLKIYLGGEDSGT